MTTTVEAISTGTRSRMVTRNRGKKWNVATVFRPIIINDNFGMKFL